MHRYSCLYVCVYIYIYLHIQVCVLLYKYSIIVVVGCNKIPLAELFLRILSSVADMLNI